MRAWGLLILITSVLVLGGTFLATIHGVLSGGMLTAIYIGYAALLAVSVVLFSVFDPRATLTPEQVARLMDTRKAANALAAHRAGVLSGAKFRLARHGFFRNDTLNVEVLEEYLLDPDARTRTLATALLVAGGPEMASWAEERWDELAKLPNTESLREALERVARLARAEAPQDELGEIFR